MPASFRTDPAMFHSHAGMLFAFRCTGIAQFGAQQAECIRKLPIQHHDLHCRTTDRGAFQVHPDTFPQTGYLRFFEAGIRALVTHDGTVRADIDTFLVFCVRHNKRFI
jgi:hypothetical protein